MPGSKQSNTEPLEFTLPSATLEKIEQYKGVVVACSGGLDSSVLFRLLWENLMAKKKFSLAICHTNFGLRGEDSDADQTFIESLAEKYQVPLFVQKITQEQRDGRKSQSLQEWARKVRYEHFHDLAENDGWLVALAHHENDLAENVILRLARGTSPGGLAGLSEWNGPFWRPLLRVPRARLENFAEQHGISYREDASNLKPDYARNRVRHELIPLLEELYPGAAGRISRCAREASELHGMCAEAWLAESKALTGDGLSLPWLRSQSRTLRHLILSRAIGRARKGRKALSHRLLERISDRIDSRTEENWSFELPAGKGRLVMRRGLLLLEK